MQLKSVILLLLALGCGLVAAIGVTQVLSKDTGAADTGNTTSLFVAIQDIAPGELITPQMVRLESWPKEKAPGGVFHKVEELQGCRARVEILAGEPLREKKLLGKGVTQQTPTDYIPKGYRVVGVKVDLVSGAGLIRPGDRVDVLVHLKRNQQNDIQENRTQTILQDIKVFAIDDVFKLQSGTGEDDAMQAKTISLLVTPDQAEKLMLAAQLGMVQLIMRSPGDSTVAATTGITPSQLLRTTDYSDREAEQQPTLPTPGSAGANGLFDLLKQMQKPEEPKPSTNVAAQPAAPGRWSIRLLQGAEVSDVTLQQETDSTGLTVWRENALPPSMGAVPGARTTSDGSTAAPEPNTPTPPKTLEPTPPTSPPMPQDGPSTNPTA